MSRTERIEILNGIWIEVSDKIKEKAGVRKSSRVVATLGGETAKAIEVVAHDGRRKSVKYSRLILEEADKIAQEKGFRKAAKITGVNKHSLDLYQRRKRKAEGRTKVMQQGSRYTLAQKQACVRLAKQIMASKETVKHVCIMRGRERVFTRPKWGHRAAFVEAGRRMGMNGRSIEWMWIQGTIPLDQQSSG
jgi:hypothetical protein